jgi:hypothetical protein
MIKDRHETGVSTAPWCSIAPLIRCGIFRSIALAIPGFARLVPAACGKCGKLLVPVG